MPLFGSGSGGAASMTGASVRSEDENSRGGEAEKEDAGEDAMGSASPRNVDDTSRSPPPREVRLTIPANETDTLIIWYTVRCGQSRFPMLPHYAWNETIIKDILGAEVQEISDVIVLSPVKCMVYSGQRSRGQGFTQAEATEIARQLHDSHTMWIGRHVWMHCILRTLRDTKVDLKAAKEYIQRMYIWEVRYTFPYETIR